MFWTHERLKGMIIKKTNACVKTEMQLHTRSGQDLSDKQKHEGHGEEFKQVMDEEMKKNKKED